MIYLFEFNIHGEHSSETARASLNANHQNGWATFFLFQYITVLVKHWSCPNEVYVTPFYCKTFSHMRFYYIIRCFGWNFYYMSQLVFILTFVSFLHRAEGTTEVRSLSDAWYRITRMFSLRVEIQISKSYYSILTNHNHNINAIYQVDISLWSEFRWNWIMPPFLLPIVLSQWCSTILQFSLHYTDDLLLK
jgi:hypothetical protein